MNFLTITELGGAGDRSSVDVIGTSFLVLILFRVDDPQQGGKGCRAAHSPIPR